jgi:hypothetical protein
LVEANNLQLRDQGQIPEPYVRARVGNDKYKSKVRDFLL